jgi:hypothetical protein
MSALPPKADIRERDWHVPLRKSATNEAYGGVTMWNMVY